MEVNTAVAGDMRSPWNMIPEILESHHGGDHAQLYSAVAKHFGSKFGSPEMLQQVGHRASEMLA